MYWTLLVVVDFVGLVVGIYVLLLIYKFWGVLRLELRLVKRVAPILDALKDNREPDPGTIQELAANPETRNSLYAALIEHERSDLFPERYRSVEAIAESALVQWLVHPNELKSRPDEIELVEVLTVTTDQGEFDYYLFKFRVFPPHWAAHHGWIAGASGPYPRRSPESPAPLEPARAYSEFRDFESQSPGEHIREIHRLIGQRVGREGRVGSRPDRAKDTGS